MNEFLQRPRQRKLVQWAIACLMAALRCGQASTRSRRALAAGIDHVKSLCHYETHEARID